MVRLKDRGLQVGSVYQELFQFHYGTIKSLPATFPPEVAIYFNSTMVRLKV